MKIFIICSKAFYPRIPEIKEFLESKGHETILPNSYGNASAEKDSWDKGPEEHMKFKSRMLKLSKEKMQTIDAVLTLNFEKHGIENYIGGATFLEIYEAFMAGKKVFLYNPIPEGMLYDEIHAFNPIIINGDLNLVK